MSDIIVLYESADASCVFLHLRHHNFLSGVGIINFLQSGHSMQMDTVFILNPSFIDDFGLCQ